MGAEIKQRDRSARAHGSQIVCEVFRGDIAVVIQNSLNRVSTEFTTREIVEQIDVRVGWEWISFVVDVIVVAAVQNVLQLRTAVERTSSDELNACCESHICDNGAFEERTLFHSFYPVIHFNVEEFVASVERVRSDDSRGLLQGDCCQAWWADKECVILACQATIGVFEYLISCDVV